MFTLQDIKRYIMQYHPDGLIVDTNILKTNHYFKSKSSGRCTHSRGAVPKQ